MSDALDEFHRDFFQSVLSLAQGNDKWTEDAFFETFTEYLISAGELDTADRTPYSPERRGIRVDGYGGDPLDSDGVLSLIVADFSTAPDLKTLTATDMNALFRRVETFVTKALDASFRAGLEETDPGFGLADLIATRWSTLSKIRLFLVTNRVLSSRVDGRPAGELKGVPVAYSVWDIGRLFRFVGSGEREELVVNLEEDFGGVIPILPAHLDGAGYEAYLLVVPAEQLASIYDRWGARLLEQNVRVFLQARGGVNKGIRNTLENDPEMFFAYNNGITATADRIDTRADGRGLVAVSLRNLQIVNGGQTTASVHAASRKKADLSRVFVQMKLSIIEASKAMEVVPKISEYANTQNRVNAADFFANHPFHIRMEEFSRRLYAPSPEGAFRQTKWFYERARGQFLDARGRLSEAQRKKFDSEYPKSQLITKTDLAKFLTAWSGQPHVVSTGSQKNFAEFAKAVGAAWDKNQDEFNEAFYRRAVAQAIVFRETERLISQQPWYKGGGIRSRVAPYALAKVSFDAAERGRFVDLEAVWQAQGLPPRLKEALTVACEAVHGVIAGVNTEIPNPLEWAKKQACWKQVQSLKVDWPKGWLESLLTKEDQQVAKQSAVKDQIVLNGIQAQTAVVSAGREFWLAAIAWAKSRQLLSPTELSILEVAANKLPSEKQSLRAIDALRTLHGEGFAEGRDLVGH